MEEEFKRAWRGGRVRAGGCYNLTYADDMVLMEGEEEMKEMIKRLEQYLREKGFNEFHEF